MEGYLYERIRVRSLVDGLNRRDLLNGGVLNCRNSCTVSAQLSWIPVQV